MLVLFSFVNSNTLGLTKHNCTDCLRDSKHKTWYYTKQHCFDNVVLAIKPTNAVVRYFLCSEQQHVFYRSYYDYSSTSCLLFMFNLQYPFQNLFSQSSFLVLVVNISSWDTGNLLVSVIGDRIWRSGLNLGVCTLRRNACTGQTERPSKPATPDSGPKGIPMKGKNSLQ